VSLAARGRLRAPAPEGRPRPRRCPARPGRGGRARCAPSRRRQADRARQRLLRPPPRGSRPLPRRGPAARRRALCRAQRGTPRSGASRGRAARSCRRSSAPRSWRRSSAWITWCCSTRRRPDGLVRAAPAPRARQGHRLRPDDRAEPRPQGGGRVVAIAGDPKRPTPPAPHSGWSSSGLGSPRVEHRDCQAFLLAT